MPGAACSAMAMALRGSSFPPESLKCTYTHLKQQLFDGGTLGDGHRSSAPTVLTTWRTDPGRTRVCGRAIRHPDQHGNSSARARAAPCILHCHTTLPLLATPAYAHVSAAAELACSRPLLAQRAQEAHGLGRQDARRHRRLQHAQALAQPQQHADHVCHQHADHVLVLLLLVPRFARRKPIEINQSCDAPNAPSAPNAPNAPLLREI